MRILQTYESKCARQPDSHLDVEISTPPLKWAGGKRWQLPHLRKLLRGRQYGRLVEPFSGGLAVSLGLRPPVALLNDINPHLINFYRWIGRGLSINFPLENDEVTYYACRNRFNELLKGGAAENSEAAGLFYYLNRTGFNGLCRFNQQGFFNVPFGRHATINYRREFAEYRQIFKGWKFSSQDFRNLALNSADLVYADPPYDVEFTQYSKDGFCWDDQVRLAEWLAHHDGPVILSNQATPRIVKLYRSLGFKLKFLDAPRMISCNGDRSPAREVLAFRNL